MKPVNKKGFALMPIIIAILIIGSLIGASLTLVVPRIKKAKYDRTGEILSSATQSVISWAIANGRLPDAAAFPSVVSRSTDDWDRQLVYIYEGNLTAIATGGVCGRSSTTLSYGTTANTAFLIVSGAEDMAVNTTPAVTRAFAGNVASGTTDLVRVLSLEELRNQAGCFSYTTGRLKILNNELPNGIEGNSYGVTFYAEGGAPPYTWSLITPSPPAPGLTFTAGTATIGNIPTTSGTYNVRVQVSDSDSNVAEKLFALTINPRPPLRILNNELPKAVSGVPYTVNIYADGGVGSYAWTAVTPSWLNFTTCTPPDAACQKLYDPLPYSGSFPVTVTIRVTDTPGNIASKTYTLTIP